MLWGGGGGFDRGKGDKDKRLTNESDSFTLLHLKVTVLEQRPVLVAVCESLYSQHLLSHSLHSREPTARQELLFLACLLKGSDGPLDICWKALMGPVTSARRQ